MCSRFNVRCCGILLALSCMLLMCARENRPPSPTFDVQLKGSNKCLSEFGSEMKRYVRGEMTKAQVVGFWDCAANAVHDFERLTSGENGGTSYSPLTLRQFIFK